MSEPTDPVDNGNPIPKKTIVLSTTIPSSEKPGDRISHYKLLQEIGEGGMGTVWMAEQVEPVRRRVALKVIKLGMDTKQVIGRFEAERQALALMDHQNIAKVLDAGATGNGRPFFVMELVKGIPITEYCDKERLNTEDRLSLFIRVCQAIQHAHQKGIIHRDIKPSNILVTMNDGAPIPKVIDFGIAKATGGQVLTDKTVFTAIEQFIGTPAYMSPEQAEMDAMDIDTRSDIYALGVLLYELLTGKTPFDPKTLVAKGLNEIRRIIREEEPQPPSMRLSTLDAAEQTTVARQRQSEPPKLRGLIRGDLDWIVMRTLEKDRRRRYDTANGLAMDIHRYLHNEPIVARPPSAAYKFQKAFRRNKMVFVAGSAVVAALVLGIIVSTWQMVRATRAERDALEAQTQEAIQRKNAEANEQRAVEAQANEARLRQQAQTQELVTRRRAYASDIDLAQRSLAAGNWGRTLDLLDQQRPQPGQIDLRGWEWRFLWQQLHNDTRFMLCQKSEIESLAVSADGRWLAIGAVHNDGLFVWDLQTKQEVAHLAPGEGRVRAIFSPTGPLLVYTTFNKTNSGGAAKKGHSVYLWNANTRQETAQFLPDKVCTGLAFSQDGQKLVTSTHNGHITLWRVSDGTKLASYPCKQSNFDEATRFAATPDLSLAAYGTDSGEIHLVDLHDGKELWTNLASEGFIGAMAFSPDGKTLAVSSGYSGVVLLVDASTGHEIGRLNGHRARVCSLAFWRDGKKLVSGSADQTIRIWDMASLQCLDELRGHRNEVLRLALVPGQNTLVSGSADGEVYLWDIAAAHPREESIMGPSNVLKWCFEPDSCSLLGLDWNGRLTRWSGPDYKTSETLLDTPIRQNGDGICFSADARLLAVCNTNKIIRVWDVPRRAIWREFKLDEVNGFLKPLQFIDSGKKLIGWSPKGLCLFEWDLEANKEIQSWPSPARYCGFDLTSDERQGVAIGLDGDSIKINVPERAYTKLPLNLINVWSVAFSPDGAHFAGASGLTCFRVWDTTSWQQEVTLPGYLGNNMCVTFSPDSRRLVTVGYDVNETVTLWDVDNWQELLTLNGAGNDAHFSPDGNALAARTYNNFLRIWRAPSLEEINAAEAKDPFSPGHGGERKAETNHP